LRQVASILSGMDQGLLDSVVENSRCNDGTLVFQKSGPHQCYYIRSRIHAPAPRPTGPERYGSGQASDNIWERVAAFTRDIGTLRALVQLAPANAEMLRCWNCPLLGKVGPRSKSMSLECGHKVCKECWATGKCAVCQRDFRPSECVSLMTSTDPRTSEPDVSAHSRVSEDAGASALSDGIPMDGDASDFAFKPDPTSKLHMVQWLSVSEHGDGVFKNGSRISEEERSFADRVKLSLGRDYECTRLWRLRRPKNPSNLVRPGTTCEATVGGPTLSACGPRRGKRRWTRCGRCAVKGLDNTAAD